MTRCKSTRWDCDTSLLRGIPNTFPAFHGWSNKSSGFYTGTNTRFNMCSICNSWVAHSDISTHPCWDFKVEEINILDSAMLPLGETTYVSHSEIVNTKEQSMVIDNTPEIEVPESIDGDIIDEEPASKYVISTEENYDCTECNICGERLILSFDDELDEWIFTDCVENDYKVVHEFCFSSLFQ